MADLDNCTTTTVVNTQPTVLQKGSSLPFEFDRDGESIDGWICTIFVKQFPGDTAIITRVVSATGCVWSGYLTSTETDTLTGGVQYFLIGVLTNATLDEEEKPPVKFYLSSKWA